MKRVKIALIGSGAGTTGAAAIDAFKNGEMPHVEEIVAFISTVPGAGLLTEAKKRGIYNFVVDDSQKKEIFQKGVATLNNLGIQLLVSAGCRRMIPEIPGVCVINDHPQDTEGHGGQDMVGLEPHLHFLEHEVLDKLRRGRADVEDPFYAKLTCHYCHGCPGIASKTAYDRGETIMQQPILIPQELIRKAWEIRRPCRKDGVYNWPQEQIRAEKMVLIAKAIQNHVLIHERKMLPKFINHVAWKLGKTL